MDIKEFLESKKEVNFIREIEFDNKKFAKAYKKDKNGIKYYYFEIESENIVREVTDKDLLECFHEIYEIEHSDIIY